jgi:hypothetical protein
VEIDNKEREYNEITPSLDSTNLTKKRKKDSPSPIALEPCVGNKAAVLSLLVRMPTGEFRISFHFPTAPDGQSHYAFMEREKS